MSTIQKVVQSVQALLGTAADSQGVTQWQPITLVASVAQKSGNTFFTMVDAASRNPVRGISVSTATLPLGLDTPIEFDGQRVKLVAHTVEKKDRNKRPTGETHAARRGQLAVKVNGKEMLVKALISQPKPDRFYVSIAVVNPSPIGGVKDATSLFG